MLRDPGEPLDLVVIATGSEVHVALGAQKLLAREGLMARVVSMPCLELFDAQPQDYRRGVLPPTLPAISVEAGIRQGWSRYAGSSVSIERFGASAPAAEIAVRLGITPEHVAARARELVR